MNISENIKAIRHRISCACDLVGRDPEEIEVVAVSKTVGPDEIREALKCGISNIGENRVQDAWKKYQSLKDMNVKWHMIGHLQRNKVKHALKFFNMIQSLDSLELAHEISRRLATSDRHIEILIEVNTSVTLCIKSQKFPF